MRETKVNNESVKRCVVYMRTSSATNVGEDKDSDKRQLDACSKYAKAHSIEIASVFYDADVKGTLDHLERDGFSNMVTYCIENGVKTVLFEDASRFSRDLMTQEKGYADMQSAGLSIIPVDMPELFGDDTNDPNRTMVRQFLGSFAQYEKASVVLKLKRARERKALANFDKGIRTISGKGKCGGRSRLDEIQPGIVKEAKRLRRANPKSGKRRSFAVIAAELFALGFTDSQGAQLARMQVKRLIEQ